MPFTSSARFDASSFSILKRSMMQTNDLPLAEVIDDAVFEQVFREHDVHFGEDHEAVYTPAITLWALISQTFFAKEQRSCSAAVARVASLWASLGRVVCNTNTGAYCRARLKIPFQAVREITKRLAREAETSVEHDEAISQEEAAEQLVPPVVANVKTVSTTGRILLVDGFTVDAADTPENQAEYPQNQAQKEGLGFPILRCVSLISMTTGLLVDLAIGSYSGKETGETALLWQMIGELREGDILVADSYYCTYWLIGICRQIGVEVVMKNHHKRDDHPADAVRLCKGQSLVTWKRPTRPSWMSREDYQKQPKMIEIRLVDIDVGEPGFRPESFTIATTITDRKIYTSEWIGSVYQSRWLVELDIRAIKCSLGMEILRAKTPEMVRTELWSCLLAYNLMRLKILQSCGTNGRDPRSMSLTKTMQMLATNWLLCAVAGVSEAMAALGQSQPADELVGHRGGRFEPRKNKRRPKVLALMTKPRDAYKSELGVAA